LYRKNENALISVFKTHTVIQKIDNSTDERESPQETQRARENSSLGFIEAVHQ